MGRETNIQWADSTVNPTTGCDGCELWVPGKGGPCYAGALHEGRLAVAHPDLYASDFTEVRLAPPRRLEQAAGWQSMNGKARPGKPWLDGMPRMIFVGDMGDVFSRDVPLTWLWSNLMRVAGTSAQGRRHLWLLLTKRPSRMVELARWMEAGGHEWPANVWAGTSVTGQAHVGRVEELRKVPAAVRFVSLEPQAGRVDPSTFLPARRCEASGLWFHEPPLFPEEKPPIHWLIQGGESNQGRHRGRPFDLAWAREWRDACRAAGVPYFLKQLGPRPYDGSQPLGGRMAWETLRDSHGGDWSEWPEDLRVREVPVPAEVAA